MTPAWLRMPPRATCQGRASDHACPLCDGVARAVLLMAPAELAAYNARRTEDALALVRARAAGELRHGPAVAAAGRRDPAERVEPVSQEGFTKAIQRPEPVRTPNAPRNRTAEEQAAIERSGR